MKCPVCRSKCDQNAHQCRVCDFNRINMDFLNVADAEAWKKNVEFAKIVWFMREDDSGFEHFNSKCNPIKRTLSQLNAYFNYDEQSMHITQHPDDFRARSWFIDCLREIYVLTGTFPLTSRKYVKSIIEEHMTYIEHSENSIGRKSEYMQCEHLIHKAEMALSDCDFTNAFRYFKEYLWTIKRFKDSDYLAIVDEAARCVLHNCYVLCDMLTVDIRICDALEEKANEYYNNDVYRKADGQALLQRIKEQERRSLYVHTLGCGLYGAYHSDKDNNWTDTIGATHEPTLDTCVFNFKGTDHYNAYDLSSLGCGLVPVEWVDGLMYRIEYITEAFSISDAIYMHKDSVERMAKDLLPLGNLFN